MHSGLAVAVGAKLTLGRGALSGRAGRGRRVGESAPVPRAGLRQARSEGLASARPSSFTSRIRLPTFLGWTPPRLRCRVKAKAARPRDCACWLLAVGCWLLESSSTPTWPAEDGDANPRGKGGGPGEQALLPGRTSPGPGDRSGFASPSSARATSKRPSAVRRVRSLETTILRLTGGTGRGCCCAPRWSAPAATRPRGRASARRRRG